MEPREAASLPVPDLATLTQAWEKLEPRCSQLDALIRAGQWETALTGIDRLVLIDTVGLSTSDVVALRSSATRLRERRTRATPDKAA